MCDEIIYERKTTPLDLEYLKAFESTLNEWNSEDDEQAYKNLQNL